MALTTRHIGLKKAGAGELRVVTKHEVGVGEVGRGGGGDGRRSRSGVEKRVEEEEERKELDRVKW